MSDATNPNIYGAIQIREAKMPNGDKCMALSVVLPPGEMSPTSFLTRELVTGLILDLQKAQYQIFAEPKEDK